MRYIRENINKICRTGHRIRVWRKILFPGPGKAEIASRIDSVLEKGYLEIEYSSRLPVIVYTEKGWEIERETYAEELFQKLEDLLDGSDFSFVAELKD